MTFLTNLRHALWGPFTIIIILLTGIYMTYSSKFVQIWCIPKLLKTKNTVSKSGVSPLEALCTSLGGTLGVGNLAGVAVAIQFGGAGAIFFMLVAAFFGMATKYSELLLAVHYQTKEKNPVGGPMVYLSNGANLNFIAKFFAICCIFSAMTTSAAAQGSAITEAIYSIIPISKILIGIILGFLIFPILCGGGKIITKASSIIVPFMTILYLISGICVIFTNRQNIPHAFNKIFSDVLNPTSASGGILGFLTSQSISYGFSKGVFSNEAGIGSAPIAHGCTYGAKPCEEGMLGALEVFIDTFVVCLITGLAILVTNSDEIGLHGIFMTTNAFSSIFGQKAGIFISIMIVFLAVSTILGWSFYGLVCLKWFKTKSYLIKLYISIIILSVVFSSFFPLVSILNLCDISAAFMAFPNILGLWVLAPVIKNKTEKFLKNT